MNDVRGMNDVRSILATDCGSTTTKAILIERDDAGSYRLSVRGEAPTTVEAPVEDVTRGVLNAVTEVQELAGRPLIDDDGQIIRPQDGDRGVDVYISTSSAGGGLQMMVAGVVAQMSAESAARAALGAGAIVMDSLAVNDGRLPHERIERLRQLRPDMIVLAGGIDGGTVSHVVEMAELLAAANPRPRLGAGFDLPVVFAGNKEAWEGVQEVLGPKVALQQVPNLRPVLEAENLGPCRDRIHDLFMEHVMAQAPGYDKLKGWTDAPIMPTPGAVGLMIRTVAERRKLNVLGVDIGGATTDVFSVFGGVFNRTVSANLGMSYSVSNVLAEAGLHDILRWVPFETDEGDLRNRIGNKMIRPTTIPEGPEDLQVEQAIAREALRLAYIQHREFATELKGVQTERTISDAFRQTGGGASLVDPLKLDLLVGSGGVLSHAPRREQAAMMLLDAFQPEGVTRLAVDSIFMMPQLGVLSALNEAAALEVFDRDCLIPLGTAVAPGPGRTPATGPCMTVTFRGERHAVMPGELKLIEAAEGVEESCLIEPAKGLDVGAGPGQPLQATLYGGVVGIYLDGRGRPLDPTALRAAHGGRPAVAEAA